MKQRKSLLGRMAHKARKAATDEVKRTVRRHTRKAARSIRKTLDNRGKPATRKATPRKRVK